MSTGECEYCETYRTAPKRTELKVGDSMIHLRWCINIGRYVKQTHEICPSFTPTKYFLCKEHGYWVVPKVCLHRQFHRHERCMACSQGEDIVDIMRGRRTKKKKLIIRRKVEDGN